MGSEAEAWWTLQFQKHSIQDLTNVALYAELQLHPESWETLTDSYSTKGTISPTAKSVTRTIPVQKRTETLSYAQETWTFVVTEEKDTHQRVTTANVKGDKQWGTITKKFETHTDEETWQIQGSDRVYERFRVESGVKKGIRTGLIQVKDTPARWVEELWEQDGETVFKKAWERPSESGGESRVNKGDYTWGENWYSSGRRFESKIWHKQLTHEWGRESGHDIKTSWKHEWDFDTEVKREDKITLKENRTSGYRYRQEGADWHKEEWDGRKFQEEEVDATALERLYLREHKGAEQSQSALDGLVALKPEFLGQSTQLKAKIGLIHDQSRSSPIETLQRIVSLRDLQDAQETLKLSIIKTLEPPKSTESQLFDIVRAHNLQDEPPMDRESLYRFFEDFLDAKYLDDNQNFEKGVSPPTVAFFLPIYVQQTAQDTGAYQKLAQLLNGLKALYGERDRYAELLCKLLAICGAEPIPYQLSLFLIRARREFQRMASTHNLSNKEAGLAATIHFVYDLFQNDVERGQELLQGMKPEDIENDDYSAFLISARLSRLQLTPAQLFQDFGSGKVKEPVLVGSLKRQLDLWLNDEEIAQVFSGVEENGFITLEAFERRIGFERLEETMKIHGVAETDFLESLVHVYNTKISKDSQRLSRAFESLRTKDLSQAKFTEVLKTWDAHLTDQQVQQIVRSVVKHAGPTHVVSKEAFVEALLDYPIGEFSKSVFGMFLYSPSRNSSLRLALGYPLTRLRDNSADFRNFYISEDELGHI